MDDVKTAGTPLTLKSALFTRTGHVQSGWALSDCGSKVYELGGSYSADAPITLYPAWVLSGQGNLIGDANADGTVNNRDTVTILGYLDNTIELTQAQVLNCDVNKDGAITRDDAQAVLNGLAGL